MENNDLTKVNVESINELLVRYVENPFNTDGSKGKYFFTKDRTTNVDQETILQLMYNAMPQVRKEQLAMAVTIFQNIIADLLMQGKSVSTLLFHATPTLRGASNDGSWNHDENQIEVSFRQGKRIRDMIKTTKVVVVGEKETNYQILSVFDHTTRATDGTATAGRCLTLTGKNIKVEGDAPEVGIQLTNEATNQKVSISIDEDLVTNTATKVTMQLPAGIPEGQYNLTITSQSKWGKHKTMFTKKTHEFSTSVFISPRE